MLSVTTYGLMSVSGPAQGFDSGATGPVINFNSQPRGILTVKDLSTGATQITNASELQSGVNKDISAACRDDAGYLASNKFEVTYSGKADQLSFDNGSLTFDGNGRAEVSGLDGSNA